MRFFLFFILILSLNLIRTEIEIDEQSIERILNAYNDVENFLVASKRENSKFKKNQDEELPFNRKFCKVNKKICYFYGK
jgi:hypothetical protein